MKKLKRLKVLYDIVYQSEDDITTKFMFVASFILHYTAKIIGFEIIYFPRMNILLQECIFITRKKTIDFWMVWEGHEKYIMNMLNKYEKTGTFIDIGANIGKYSILLAKRGWKVYSFEPIRSSYEMLKYHSVTNKVNGNIKIFNVAIGEITEKRKIYYSSYKTGEASISFKSKDSICENIYVEKLDNILLNEKMEQPMIMKIDVEGHEYEVLLGAKEIIKNYKPIIIIEMWNYMKDIDLLHSLGYNTELYRSNKSKKGIFYPY